MEPITTAKVATVALKALGTNKGRKAFKGGLLFAAAIVLGLVVMAAIAAAVIAAILAALTGMCGAGYPGTDTPGAPPSGEAVADIPANYLAEYQAAAREDGIDWAVLAAIGKVESDHGRANGGSCATSSAGAQGPMQFMPATWSHYGVDGPRSGDGRKNACDFKDAIPAAAGYLVASGAPEDYRSALLAYNHAQWYVDKVLGQAEAYRRAAGSNALQASSARFGTVRGTVSAAISPVANAFAMREAHASELSWDLVDSNLNLHYEDHTSYDDALNHGVSAWNALGTVNIARSPGSSETDVKVGDMYLPGGQFGVTSSDGTMYFDSSQMGSATSSARRANGAHEWGHALRMGHASNSVLTPTITLNSSSNIESPTGYDRAEYYRIWGRSPGAGGAGAALGSDPTAPADCPEAGGGGAPYTPGGEIVGTADGKQVVQEAMKYLGTPYVLGGMEVCDPGVRMDCTCLTLTVFKQFGTNMPDCPECQWKFGQEVTARPPPAGALLVWGDPGDGTGGHTAIAMGDGRILHASIATGEVSITPMWQTPQYWGARQLVR